MIDINAVRAQFAEVHAAATKFEDDNKDKQTTPEQDAEQDARFKQMDGLQKQLTNAEKLASYKFAKGDVQLPTKSPDQIAFEKEEVVQAAEFSFDNAQHRADFSRGMTDWFAGNTSTGPAARFSTLTTSTDSKAFLPKVVTDPFVLTAGNSIREAMAAVGVQPVSLGTTAEWNEPVLAPAIGTDLSEGADSGAENGGDGSAMWKKINLRVFGITSDQVWISNLEARAVNYNVFEQVVPALEEAKEMRLEQKVLAAIIADSSIAEVETGGIGASSLGYPDLSELNHSLSKRFDRKKVMILSTTAYARAAGDTGSDNHPIHALKRNPVTGVMEFEGTPVVKSDYLEAFGNGNVVGMIVSFVGFRLRDEGPSEVIKYPNDKAHTGDTGMDLVGYHAYGYLPEAITKLVSES